ncbi:MAG: hypothetical protein AB1631_10100 [Acidobacteriota bacterium]
MKRMILVITGICAFLLFGDEAQTQTQKPTGSDTGWMTKVVQASQPAKVSKRGGRSAREYPGAGKQWLYLVVEVKPPQKDDGLPLEAIRVVDDSGGIYPALAIDCPAKEQGDQMFFFLEDAKNPQAAGVFLIGRAYGLYDKEKPAGSALACEGDAFIAVRRTGGDQFSLRFYRDKAMTLFLLFETPVASKQPYLQVGEGARIPVGVTR